MVKGLWSRLPRALRRNGGVEVHKGISAIIVVVVGLLGIAGCGDDSSITRAEYEQQAELICNEGLKDREQFFKEVSAKYARRSPNASAKEQAEEQAQNVRGLMDVYQVTTEELADLDIPEQGGKKAEELLKAREDGAAQLKADPQKMSEFLKVFAKASKSANGLGVVSCGK
jgi:hypothetical protein